jgi:hypothetical protein
MTDWAPGKDWKALLELLRADELSTVKPAYAYCAALACIEAAHCGYSRVVVAEFGVAWGEGLRELAAVGGVLSRMTGIQVSVAGFDRHGGLPRPHDYRDHPEVWAGGQFANQELTRLRQELDGQADLAIGDLADTVPAFTRALGPGRPLGAVMLDVDLYSSARDALRVFAAAPDCYLPSVPMYVDDVDALLTFNGRCGEALAIAEHNAAEPSRFIEAKRVRVGWPAQRWHRKIYACHVLDHPGRNGSAPRHPLEIHLDHY